MWEVVKEWHGFFQFVFLVIVVIGVVATIEAGFNCIASIFKSRRGNE